MNETPLKNGRIAPVRRWRVGLLPPALLVGLLSTAGCGRPTESAAPDTARADASKSPATPGTGARLDTSHDLSKLSAQATPTPQSPSVARQDGPRGIQEPVLLRNGGLSLFEGTDTHDFGTIRQGSSEQHSFEMISDGEEPLVISGVKPSCGCTKADLTIINEDGSSTPYERGQEIPVGTRFRLLTELSTDGKMGTLAAQVSLYSNAIKSPNSMRLMAEVEPVLEILPNPTLYFGQITTGDEVEGEVEVVSKRGEHFLLTLKKEGEPVEALDVEYAPTEPDAEGKSSGWKVSVSLGPNIPIGVRNYPVRFDTDIEIPSPKYPNPDGSPKYFMAQLNVQARVTGMVHADPAFISFGMVEPGQVIERALRIECHDDFVLSPEMAVTIEGLQGQEFPYADFFVTTAEPVEGDSSLMNFKMRLEGLPEGVNGSFGGILKIGVAHPWMDELSVRFSGVCRPPVQGRSSN